jgi:hypothetical protein
MRGPKTELSTVVNWVSIIFPRIASAGTAQLTIRIELARPICFLIQSLVCSLKRPFSC